MSSTDFGGKSSTVSDVVVQVPSQPGPNRIRKSTLAAAVRARHRAYYIEQVERDPEDWQRIELIYPQIKRAWAATRDGERLMFFCDTLSAYQYRRGFWQDQQDWSWRCLQWAEQVGRRDIAARCLQRLGEVYVDSNTDRETEAEALLERARAFAEQTEDFALLGRVLVVMAQIYLRQGRLDEAWAILNEVLASPPLCVAEYVPHKALILRSDIYIVRRQWDKAIHDLKLVLSITEAARFATSKFYALQGLGNVYWRQGRWVESEKVLRQCVDLVKDSGLRNSEPQAFLNWGWALIELKRWKDAHYALVQSLQLHREAGQRSGEAYCLNGLGLMYCRQAEWAKAQRILTPALEIAQETGNKFVLASILKNLGAALHEQRRDAEAKDHLHRSLFLFRELQEQVEIAEVRSYLDKHYQA